MNAANVFLWVIVPYTCIATFVLGHIWRYRYDKFGWTTRSSQLYERRLLRIGSPCSISGSSSSSPATSSASLSPRQLPRRWGSPKAHITSPPSPWAPSRGS